jgi:formate/nitrite transporter FocA (FNT family)
MPARQPPPQEPEPPSEERDRKEAEERSAVGAHVIYEAIRMEGEEELSRPTSALAWSGFAAGLSMGFSLVSEGVLRYHLPDTPWRPLITKLGYAVGFLIVTLGRQQLYTENTLTPIIPLLSRKSWVVTNHVLRLWAAVLLANLVGTMLFALVVGQTGVFDYGLKATLADIGREAAGRDFGVHLLTGIFAGWLIALMVWMLPGGHFARFWIIILITYLIGLARFSHIIAGSVNVFYLVATGELSFGAYVGSFLVPVFLGNTLGGVALVAALNHAQVVAGEEAA